MKVDSVEEQLRLVSHMSSLQCQHVIIARSIQHQLNYIFRCTPCGDIAFADLAGRYDKLITSTIARCPHHYTFISDLSSAITFLPLSKGGIGLRKWFDTADSAYLASYLTCANFLINNYPRLKPAFPQLHPSFIPPQSPHFPPSSTAAHSALIRLQAIDKAVTDLLKPTPDNIHQLQTKLSSFVHQRNFQLINAKLLSSTSPYATHFRAHFLSSQGDSHSFQTIPIDTDTTLNNRQMMIAVILKTLTPLIPANLQCTDHSNPTVICPCCSKSCDSFGIHSFQCPKDGHKYRTQLLHDKLCRVWCSALRHAGYKVLLEPSGMVLSNGKRPDLVIQLENGTTLFIDLRTCDPLLSDIVEKASTTSGVAANKGEALKNKDWKELLDTQGDPFLPICHERGGLISDGALNLLRLASLQFSPSLHA